MNAHLIATPFEFVQNLHLQNPIMTCLRFKEPDIETITFMLKHLLKQPQNIYLKQIMMGMIPYLFKIENLKGQFAEFFEDNTGEEPCLTRFSEIIHDFRVAVTLPKLTDNPCYLYTAKEKEIAEGNNFLKADTCDHSAIKVKNEASKNTNEKFLMIKEYVMFDLRKFFFEIKLAKIHGTEKLIHKKFRNREYKQYELYELCELLDIINDSYGDNIANQGDLRKMIDSIFDHTAIFIKL